VRASLLDYLNDFAIWGGECAYVYPRGYRHERWSYRQVAETAYRFARELQAHKLGRGDAVLLWCPNSGEWVAAFFGCALCGVIAVPIDDAASPEFARRISAQVRTRLVLCARERAGVFEGIEAIDPAELRAAISQHSAAPFRPVEIQPSDTLEIVFTSGTTAEPKGVVITHANVLANVTPLETEIRKYLRYERLVHPIRFLNLLPLSHVFGQFLGIFLPPLMGGTVVFEQSLNPTEVMATIRRERVSVLVAVPRMIESLKQKIERDLENVGRRENFVERCRRADEQHYLRRWWTFRDIRRQFGWKFWAMISGGAALDRETEQFWHRLGYALIQGYGLTETTSLISVNHPFKLSRGSIGKVLPGREIRLAEDGEILVRGSGVASGYWNGHELEPVAGEEGWYQTGDLGAVDQDNNLFFKGRKKEVIVTPAGMNVYPEDLEAALREQKEVRDCVVVGLERGGNAEPCAVLMLRERGADAEAVVMRANQTLAEYQRMRTWFLWPDEDFPRTSTQKARRNVIRDAVEAGLRGRTGESARPSTLAELLSKVTGRAPQALASGADLENGLGLSSLERVELLGALEDRYQVDLSETQFAQAATISDLEKLLQGGQGERRQYHYPRWALRWPVRWVRLAAHYLLMRPAMLVLGWPRIVGRENLRGIRGPLLIVSNHVSDVDVGFVQTALPPGLRHRLATATGGEALEALRSAADRPEYRRIYDRMRWFMGVALLNLFPLPRQSGFRKSFAYAGEAVDLGYSVLVFPEGRHTEDGNLNPFRAGVGLLANNLLIPVLPMRIDGLYELKKTGRRLAAPGRIQVRIGKPVQFPAEKDPAEIAVELQGMVAEL